MTIIAKFACPLLKTKKLQIYFANQNAKQKLNNHFFVRFELSQKGKPYFHTNLFAEYYRPHYMEDALIFFNGKRPKCLEKWKKTSIISKW